MAKDKVTAFWSRFLDSRAAQNLSEAKLYGTFSIGSSKEDADAGATLVLENRKTATSSLPSDYDEPPGPPYLGALSILLDGYKRPVAVVETIELCLRRLDDLDEAFARDYGEWDRTPETLKTELEAYYRPLLASRDKGSEAPIELLCERFRVIFSDR